MSDEDRALGVPDSYFAMRDRVLSDAARGSFYAVAMSERGSGSRLSGVTTTYEPKGPDGYHIRGSKAFCSGAGHADGYLVAARNGELVHGHVPILEAFDDGSGAECGRFDP